MYAMEEGEPKGKEEGTTGGGNYEGLLTAARKLGKLGTSARE